MYYIKKNPRLMISAAYISIVYGIIVACIMQIL